MHGFSHVGAAVIHGSTAVFMENQHMKWTAIFLYRRNSYSIRGKGKENGNGEFYHLAPNLREKLERNYAVYRANLEPV